VTRRPGQLSKTVLATLLSVIAGSGCGSGDDKTASAGGGRLVATSRTEPESFNRFVHPTATVELISRLTHASLVRLNRVTRTIEPRLARSWTTSPDGLTWTLNLVENATFSDGTPFTAADVVFSFRAAYDADAGSPLGSSLQVDGQPLTVRALDAGTVAIVFPAPYGPGIAMLDSLPILPAHKLQAALDAKTFKTAWGVTTQPADLAGLGPFVIKEYAPGQRLVFARNPRYWRQDERGQRLPYLDEIEVQFVADQNSEVVRLQAGQVDLMTDTVRAEDIASFRRLGRDAKITLTTAGVSVSPDALWFNLTPAAPAVKDRPWLQREELRRAISHAVDRRAFVDTVFLGAAEPIFGPITPGHGDWYIADLPKTDYDTARAASLLQAIGLQDRNGDGRLDDDRGRPARFTILTQKGHAVRERSVAFIQEALRKVGLTVDVVTMETNALMPRWGARDYDAIYRALNFDSFDPGRSPEFWSSSGGFHLWNPGQTTPATPWEARIDDLIRQQSRTRDEALRRRLFADAQRVLAEHLPILYFAAPHVTVATSARLRGSTPSVLPPPVLWNAEALSIAR
jgi:peptide/nickel transport system substrate-binding protein